MYKEENPHRTAWDPLLAIAYTEHQYRLPRVSAPASAVREYFLSRPVGVAAPATLSHTSHAARSNNFARYRIFL